MVRLIEPRKNAILSHHIPVADSGTCLRVGSQDFGGEYDIGPFGGVGGGAPGGGSHIGSGPGRAAPAAGPEESQPACAGAPVTPCALAGADRRRRPAYSRAPPIGIVRL